MPKVEVLVKVDDAYAEKLSEIAKQCQAAGMTISQQMKSVGMISGSIEKSNVAKIERINGVSYVEESKPVSNA